MFLSCKLDTKECPAVRCRESNARRVVLVFDYLNIESGFDFVKVPASYRHVCEVSVCMQVYETNPAGKLLGLFSGSMTPPTVFHSEDARENDATIVQVVSTTSILYVQFITDGTVRNTHA